jgi:DNA-directed RNA polymerase specialized sigma24 family protein
MSPLTLRRYRAERLLRQEFEALRGRVLATVQGRLGASGARLDRSDLDACYAQAWQGLYAAVLDGQEIANPTGWLTVVTFRRAVEELRADRYIDRDRGHRGPAAGPGTPEASTWDPAEEPDLAGELDDRTRLRHLFEGLRGRLNEREREAAAFCYLQGLSRSEAAARMGVSEARMRKLMDGQGAGRPGVAAKVGELAETIRAGSWCEEQGSLMRGLAYGILDPDGERHRLALIHRSECPACRAYVVSLRGLAAILPPVLLPWGLGAGVLARARGVAHAGAGIGAHPSGAAQSGAGLGSGAGAQAGAGLGAGVSASGAASVGGAAGGSWLLAGGPLGAKLAVGCLLALGVGAGCVALTDGPGGLPAFRHSHRSVRERDAANIHGAAGGSLNQARLTQGEPDGPSAGALAHGRAASVAALSPSEQAAREFGPEHVGTGAEAGPSFSAGQAAKAISASSDRTSSTPAGSSAEQSAQDGSSATAAARSAEASSAAGSGAPTPADREFGIG